MSDNDQPNWNPLLNYLRGGGGGAHPDMLATCEYLKTWYEDRIDALERGYAVPRTTCPATRERDAEIAKLRECIKTLELQLEALREKAIRDASIPGTRFL